MGQPSLGPLSLLSPQLLSLASLTPFLVNPNLTMKASICGLQFGSYLGVEKMTDY